MPSLTGETQDQEQEGLIADVIALVFENQVQRQEIDRLKAVIKAAVLALRGTPHPPDWSEEPTVEYVANVLEQATR